MLGLRHGEAVAGHDDDVLRHPQQECGFVGLDRLTAPAAAISDAVSVLALPNARRDVRHGAVHCFAHRKREQRAGGADERAGDEMRARFEMAKHPRDGRPVNEYLSSEITTGMSRADRHNHEHPETRASARK